jgi:C-terminal processing protease CtpA/Prc
MKNTIIFLLILFSLSNSTCQISNSKENIRPPIELTDLQKIEDVKFMFEFIKYKSPFRNVLEHEFGFPNLKELEKDYIEKAKKAKTNKEFIQNIGELVQILGQGNCHTSILSTRTLFEQFEPSGDTIRLSSKLGITKKAIELGDHWLERLDYSNKNWHSDLEITYKDGYYITQNELIINDKTIEKGSIITSINGLKPLDYIISVQHMLPFRWDTKLKKPFSSSGSPFSVNADNTKNHWEVEFLTPNNNKVKLLLEKKKGFMNTMNYPSLNMTILCKKLREDLAYIKVYGFPDTVNIKKDRKIISNFFENAKEGYENLIIDFRGHGGGNAVYGEHLFVKPFLDRNYIYTQYATVDKEIFDNSIQKYQTLDSFKKSFARVIDFGKIQKINFHEFPDFIKRNNSPNNNYYYFKTTRNIIPKNKYNFKGRIFLLIDNNCYSASETIIRIHQQLGLSTIIGANSGGGEGAVHAPLIYEVPNCHLLFRTEMEMTFNADGATNELFGTKPDVNLEPSTYPTSFPKSFDINILLKDKWIDWIINNEL